MTTHQPLLCRHVVAGVIAAAIIGMVSPLHAEIRISGTEALVKLEAEDAALSDIMAQFGAMYGVTFQSVVPQDRAVSGRYIGPLRKVIARLLERENYVARLVDGRLVITSYGSFRTPGPEPLAARAVPVQRPIVNPKGTADGGYMR